MKKLIVSVVLFLTLSACGGGGTGSGGSSNLNISSGLNVPDVRLADRGIQEPEYIDSQGYRVVDQVFFPIYIDRELHGDTSSGRYYDVNTGEWFGLRSYEDTASGSFIILESYRYSFVFKNNDQTNFELFGFPSGVHQYKGFNTAAAYNSTGDWHGIGSFAMNANFTSGQGYIKANTTLYTDDDEFSQNWDSELEGFISLNTNTGDYFGQSLNLRVANIHSPAFISGRFHGKNASGVTGIYVGLGDNSDVEGSIAGRNCSVYKC